MWNKQQAGPGQVLTRPGSGPSSKFPGATDCHSGGGRRASPYSRPHAPAGCPGDPGPRTPAAVPPTQDVTRASAQSGSRTSGQVAPPSAYFLRPPAPPLPTLPLFGAVRSEMLDNSTWEVSRRKCPVINFTQQEAPIKLGGVREPPSHESRRRGGWARGWGRAVEGPCAQSLICECVCACVSLCLLA